MLAEYRGQRVRMCDLERFVIEKTDYLPTHARSILKRREQKRGVVVQPVPGYRRKPGTFKSDKVDIVFPSVDLNILPLDS
jgi:hypothetical protein